MPSAAMTQFDRIEPARTPLPVGPAAWILATIFLLVAAPALATTYKWTDANGRVVYSDQRPVGNYKVEEINAPPPPANPDAVKDLANREAELQKRRMLRAEEEDKAAKTRVEANLKRSQCERARGQAITLAQSDQIVIYTTNAQGERTPMDDAARLRERQQLEAWIRENCRS